MILRSRPRVFLDIELYRPPTRRGRSGFFSDKTKLIAVSIAVDWGRKPGELISWTWVSRDEKDLLRKTLSTLRQYAGRRDQKVLSGYGIFRLDIPFLIQRAALIEPDLYYNMRETLLRGFIHVDMFQAALLAYTGKGLPSMASFYSALRMARGLDPVPEKPSGFNVHELYERGNLEAIKKYSSREIGLIAHAYSLLLDPGPVYPERLPDEWRRLARILPEN